MAFGRRSRRAEPDPDLIAEGLGGIAAELHRYAERSPAVRAELSDRVRAALAGELPYRARIPAATLLQRFAHNLRPTSVRSLLAATLLLAAIGAGAALAAAGALPFRLPNLAPAEAPAPHAPQVPIVDEPRATEAPNLPGPTDADVDPDGADADVGEVDDVADDDPDRQDDDDSGDVVPDQEEGDHGDREHDADDGASRSDDELDADRPDADESESDLGESDEAEETASPSPDGEADPESDHEPGGATEEPDDD
jgi:hypothetical protein